ncbi:MAG: hypothetical protein HC916_10735 [Coleofasciculaceae cyanobacterium SM2_1_6]|nr:hypothetical protein [Coleofasciculaceae cyanobacterium SM2_1_6]
MIKGFCRGYAKLLDRVQALITIHNQDSYFQDSDRLHQFSQKLLRRILFLYFLQAQGWLGGDRHFLQPNAQGTIFQQLVL